MKHYLLQTANGLHTPPCSNSHGKLSQFFNFRFSLFTPLLVLFLLIVGNSPAWASSSTSYFTPGATIYFHVTNSCKDWGSNGNVFQVILFDKDDNTKAIKTDNSTTIMDACDKHDDNDDNLYNFTGSGHYIASDVRRSTTKINDNYYSFTIPASGKNVGFIRLIKNDSDHDGWVHQSHNQFSADDISANKNCFAFSAWENGTVSLEEYSGGATVTTGSGGGSDPEPVENEYYVFGAGGTNWVTGWTRKVPEYKLTEEAGVYTKTFYNVKGYGLEFKVCDQNNNEYTWDKFNQSKSNVNCTQNGTNIDFNTTGTKNYQQYWDVTVHFDGTEIWVTRELSELGFSDNEFYIMGGGNNWTWDKNTRTDYNRLVKNGDVASVSYPNINGNCSFKVFRASDTYEINWDYYSALKSTGTPMKNNGDDNIGMTFDGTKQLTIYFDGKNIWTNLADNVPAVTYTVTLHPNNGGSDIIRENVPEGSNSSATELNLSKVTYGKGTATWYTDAACTTPFTTVTGDMHLYAKWGVSGNYYFVSSLQTASDAGETGNWNSGWAKQLNYTSGNPGKCSYSFIAPAGRLPFELLTSTSDWNSIGADNNLINNDASNVTVAVSAKHFYFELPEPKKVTISYDGKVSINVEDYNFDNTKTWHIKTSWASSGGKDWNYNTVLTNSADGGSVTLPVKEGDRSFIISTKTNDIDAQKVVGTETFNALYVDTSNPSSGFNWRMTTAKLEGSGEFNKQLPQADGNYWRNCAFHVDADCDIRITFDGGKIRCDIVAPNIVTFKDGENTLSTQEVSNGGKATQPTNPTKSGYTFVKWQLDGRDYDFNSAVTGNITLNAVWAYKGIESISLNESEHMTWVGNSDFTLTPTYSPSDVITKAVTWSSNNTSVATVNNDGIVHAVGADTATITCTITDMLGNQRSATCEVTVAACEMTTDNIYSMTVTSYNSSTGSSANLNGLWDESAKNDEPKNIIKCKVRIANTKYAVDKDNKLQIDDTGDDWFLIPAGKNNSNQQLYYIKNSSTKRYIKFGTTRYMAGAWELYETITTDNIDNNYIKDYQFYTGQCGGASRIVSMHGNCSENYDINTNTDFFLHCYLRPFFANALDCNLKSPNVALGKSDGCQSGNIYLRSDFVNMENIPNPNYLASQMNGSYYRMNTGATVKANLGNVLVKGAVITVRLYADAATSVQLTKENGTEVNTIPLAADTEFEYSYTVNNDSPLLGESAFVIKATDNHAGIASIKVTHTYVANPSDPELSWETDLNGGVKQSALGSTFRHVASSTLSLGAIHYVSSNEAVATVAADGTVTPHSAGTTTITATIAADGCYKEASISYNITLTEASLQDLIDATPVDGTLTLTHNYSENAVINKAITLDAKGYTIGDLTVEDTGDLTLSSELTVRDFTICAKAGNTSIPAASGQVRNASELNVNGNAYFLYTVDPSGQIHYGWYDFTVPFPINIVSGIKGIQGSELKEDFRNGVDYAVMEYFGDKQAQGQYPYKKFSGIMQPNKLYTITLSDYNTLRMQKTADGALVAGDKVTLNPYTYTGGDAINANWNGVGNGTLHHADAGISGNYIQVYQSGSKTFLPVNKNDYSLVVGSAFMVQETGTMMLNQATHNKLLAPSRYESAPATAIQIASEGKPFSDQLFITASETGGQAYTPGVDVAKAGELGSASVPQIWTNAYNSSLCVHEAQLINGKAQYKLSIYAPVAGAYTLTSKNIPADYSLYLTQNGMIVSELSDTYTLDLSKGITTEYGLLLTEIYNSPTGIENTQTDKIQTTKIIRNGVLYILHNGKVYNAQGAMVK